MICNRSLKGSSARMGSGRRTFANEPLWLMPSGMQVLGSNPWFCMKKITRFGVVLLAGDAATRPGTSEEPNAAPAPAAIPCSIFLRLIMIDLLASGLLAVVSRTGHIARGIATVVGDAKWACVWSEEYSSRPSSR